ncbi:hypothetical protein LV83_01316 [Algoriphagus yeomjeoni]|uniref:Uncharacterized protein n=1 Tax=Algoriphagus yeomjeoni TaxID=291403 RepID=A0A327PIU7_9BACT|nr:hypothetical protein LV83_01316 [Algoriphagus yeomjeoni]
MLNKITRIPGLETCLIIQPVGHIIQITTLQNHLCLTTTEYMRYKIKF